MSIMTKSEFQRQLLNLKCNYPGYLATPEQFNATVNQYYQRLGDYPEEAIKEAVEKTPLDDYYPDRFPSCGQLHRVIRESLRGISEQQEEKQRAIETAETDKKTRAYYNSLPSEKLEQEVYIREAEKPFERLARQWEIDTIRRDVDCCEPTPKAVGRPRLRLFWKLWEECDDKDEDTFKYKK